ncbi:MAG: hypothetical protein MJ014_01080 [Methanocorpusculum sp.]|nr:hypothetical protein [Methanocorpusculum sp.]
MGTYRTARHHHPATAATPAQPLPSVSAAATTAVPASITAADTIPTLTQAPSPVCGLLPALITAGLLLRKRHP